MGIYTARDSKIGFWMGLKAAQQPILELRTVSVPSKRTTQYKPFWPRILVDQSEAFDV